jgi:diacylglycerol kinase (ATP)
MPRLKLIVNPQADHGHAAEHEESQQSLIEAQAAAAGSHELAWVETERPRHAIELAQVAAEEGFDVVVAIGGDGTVHEVVNGLMQVDAAKRPRLGVIPVGSGNDFAHNLGLPDTAREAATCLLGDTTRTIDAGLIIDGSGRREYWDNTIGIGFSGAVNIATRSKTMWRGFLLYLISVLETILLKPPALEATMEIDQRGAFKRSISMVSICNGPREGGGFPVSPSAVMDDGLLSYTIMRGMSRLNLLRFLPVVMNAQHMKHVKFFEGGTAQRVRVDTAETMAIHADGEVFGPWEAGLRHVEVSIIPSALEVLCNC